MSLYLNSKLLNKGPRLNPEGGRTDNTADGRTAKQGEMRGGSYRARVQIGYEDDGSPRYKYFDSIEERDRWVENKSRDKQSKELADKTEAERVSSKKKQAKGEGKVSSGKLFVKDKDVKEGKKKDDKKDKDKDGAQKDDEQKVKKSIPIESPMFIWRID